MGAVMTASPARQRLLSAATLALLALPAAAEDELGWTTRLVAEGRSARGDSPFAAGLGLTSFGRDRQRIEQELRGRQGPVNFLLTATASGREGAAMETKLVAREAYADFSLGGQRFSAGKKVLSGDVGHAFRPIDVLQRESRQQLAPPPLEGIPSVAWEHFDADGAWSLIVANPGHGRRGEARDDGALALKAYRRLAGVDVHGVARHSGRHGLELGAGLAAVPDESLEVHGSLLVQQRGERRRALADGASVAQLLDAERAVGTETLGHTTKALIGGTWTSADGLSILVEHWWDGGATPAEDWARLARQAERRRALLGVPGVPAAAVAGTTAASTRLFDQANLVRRGLLLRASWNDAASGWTLAADLLRSQEDGGHSVTLSAAWAGDRVRVEGGLRRYGGPADAAFRLLPEKSAAFVALSLPW